MAFNMNMNRNSTPDAPGSSSLRPPSSRTIGSGHIQRVSADMGGFSAASAANRMRPSSEVLSHQQLGQQRNSTIETELADQAVQEWLKDVEDFEQTLNEMAAATLDQDFKDELSAIEQWFKVLSEAERTAALYSLLQQTTQVQTRFFMTVLQHNSRQQPNTSMLSPSSLDKDAMNNKLTEAMEALKVKGTRNSFARPLPSPSTKRNSGLSTQTVHKMFPEAAAAIQNKRDSLMQQAGSRPTSLLAPSMSSPQDEKPSFQAGPSAWDRVGARPKSSEQQPPMGQYGQAPPGSAGLRSPRNYPGAGQIGSTGPGNIQNTTVDAPRHDGMPQFSPLPGMNSWASQMNTPMVANFGTAQQIQDQQQHIANTAAMKLAAISTVNNRISLDDAKKYRKKSPGEAMGGLPQPPISPGLQQPMVHPQLVMTNDQGMVMGSVPLTQVQAANALLSSQRSRPNSPGIALQGAAPGMQYAQMQQQSGYLQTPFLNTPGMGMGQLSAEHGYLSDHSDVHQRGRSPRGRRGSSRPPEDPTDPELLRDIPSWLRSLRLHKYTENLKDMKWQELVMLDDAGLEARGVQAVGARKKMLKVFSEVNQAVEEGKIG